MKQNEIFLVFSQYPIKNFIMFQRIDFEEKENELTPFNGLVPLQNCGRMKDDSEQMRLNRLKLNCSFVDGSEIEKCFVFDWNQLKKEDKFVLKDIKEAHPYL